MIIYFFQLLKFRLSITVVFSAMIGYLLGVGQFNLQQFTYLIFGGFLVTGSANAFNQILEKDKDKLMERTAVRPLPQNNLSCNHPIEKSSGFWEKISMFLNSPNIGLKHHRSVWNEISKVQLLMKRIFHAMLRH